MGDLNLNLVKKMVFTEIKDSETAWHPNGIKGCDEETFLKINPAANKSIFQQLDIDNDGYVSEDEYGMTLEMDTDHDGIVTDTERNNACMQQMKIFARRGVDKWFKVDKNRDGFGSNIEWESWNREDGKSKDGPLSNAELARKYNMEESLQEDTEDNIQNWLDDEINGLIDIAKSMYDVELSEKQIIELKKEQMKQLNTWLFKTGDGKESTFYEQLNNDAYTRLVTKDENVSCCGGDIGRPPTETQPQRSSNGEVEVASCGERDYLFSSLRNKLRNKESSNSSIEVKRRLAWAMFSTKKLDELADMTPEDYAKHRADWERIREMKASDFKELLKPENQAEKEEFEENSCMTVEQIVGYIEIVEGTTGKEWDSEDWNISSAQFDEIVEKVNGTFGDDTRLDGKTRADIPENRQALLKFLEEKGWLYEQFK